MASLFTRIIDGEIPGRFVWVDDLCVAFLTIEPRQPGHAMVVPRLEIDQWVDLPTDIAAHAFAVAGTIGAAQRAAFGAARIGLVIEGYEVPHAHIHVWPSCDTRDFEAANIRRDTTGAELDAAAERLRERLRADGHAAWVPSP